MNGAQALIESLKRENVEHMFGYAGATICPAVDALKAHPEIAYTLVRTEQNAGHMASGYARMSGKVGVCMVTSGPGATNLITGIATAYMDSIPMVAITGQVPSNLLGRDIFQEVDITGAVAPFSKHSYLVKDANDIPRVVKEAFHIASTGRPGPVLIDIPIDVQEQTLKKFQYPEAVNIRGYKPSVKGNDLQIKRVVEAISRSKQPLICAGGGVWLADAKEELLELAVRNPETVDFVADYPQEKDRPPAETVEEAEQGSIPLLLQWDPRWGCAQYGDGPMALNGCGPTALSMVICGLTGDGTATPYAVAQYAQEMGYYVDGVGTSWELMSAGGTHFGVTARELPLSQSVMENALAAGEPIICSVGPGDFTTSGHFIVLSGLEDGKFQVRDPNRHSTSEKLWDYDTLAGQITNLWAFSVA